MMTEQHLQDFEQLGYFIVDDAHQPGTIEEMREAAHQKQSALW